MFQTTNQIKISWSLIFEAQLSVYSQLGNDDCDPASEPGPFMPQKKKYGLLFFSTSKKSDQKKSTSKKWDEKLTKNKQNANIYSFKKVPWSLAEACTPAVPTRAAWRSNACGTSEQGGAWWFPFKRCLLPTPQIKGGKMCSILEAKLHMFLLVTIIFVGCKPVICWCSAYESVSGWWYTYTSEKY